MYSVPFEGCSEGGNALYFECLRASCLGHYAPLPDNCIPTLSQQIERRRKRESRTAQETPCKDTKKVYGQRRHHERVLLFDHDSAQFRSCFVHWPRPLGGMRLALISPRHLCPVPRASLACAWEFRTMAGLPIESTLFYFGAQS